MFKPFTFTTKTGDRYEVLTAWTHESGKVIYGVQVTDPNSGHGWRGEMSAATLERRRGA